LIIESKKFKNKLTPKPKNYKGEWEGRKEGNYKWYEIQDAVDYYNEFEKPKLMLPDIAVKNQVIYEPSNFYTVNTAYILPVDDKFLLGVLNSNLVLWFYSNITSSIRGGYLRFIRQYLEQIPISSSSEAQRTILEEIVNQILTAKAANPAADTTALETEIDRLVYALYGLTEEEIAIVEG
jgi:hypothetical protein